MTDYDGGAEGAGPTGSEQDQQDSAEAAQRWTAAYEYGYDDGMNGRDQGSQQVWPETIDNYNAGYLAGLEALKAMLEMQQPAYDGPSAEQGYAEDSEEAKRQKEYEEQQRELLHELGQEAPEREYETEMPELPMAD